MRLALVPTFLLSHPLTLLFLSSYPLSLILISSYLLTAIITCGVDGSRGWGLRLALVPTFLLSHRLIILLPCLRIILSYPLILVSSYPLISTITCGVDGSRGWGLRLALVPTEDNEAKLPSLPSKDNVIKDNVTKDHVKKDNVNKDNDIGAH